MADEHARLHQLCVDEVWSCLTAPSYINPSFRVKFPTKETLSALMFTMAPSFCPELLHILDAAESPPVSFFDSWPDTIPSKTWAVYALVYRKTGHRPILYIGSATDQDHGVESRFRSYRTSHMLPEGIRIATSSGFTLASQKLLITSPIPAAAIRPQSRLLFVALEAVLTNIFWALRNKNRNYGFLENRKWPKALMAWDGACTHSPLIEGVSGTESSLSPEELEAAEAARLEQNRKRNKDWYEADKIKNPGKAQEAWRISEAKKRPKLQQERDEAVQNKTFFCELCDHAFGSQRLLDRHLQSPTHQNRTAPRPASWYCEHCEKEFRFESGLKEHLRSPQHLRWEEWVLHRVMPENSEFPCDQCKIFLQDKITWQRHLQDIHSRLTEESSSNDASKLPFFCSICQLRHRKKIHYDEHCKTQNHINLERYLTSKEMPEGKKFFCESCRSFIASDKSWQSHLRSPKHKSKEEEANASSATKIIESNHSGSPESHSTNHHDKENIAPNSEI